MTGRDVVSMRNVSAGYDGETVLEDIDLSLRELDFVGMVGPNGGGKTTLLKLLLGLLPPTRGHIEVLGQAAPEARCHVGYVPQHTSFDPSFPIRVRDVVYMGRLGRRSMLRSFTAADHEVVTRVIDDVELSEVAGKTMGELSGGQRQRVLIARALAVEPTILLLDEPTASIDPKVTGTVYDLLRRLNEHITILLVTHDMAAISSYVKTVGCLNRTLHYHGKRELTAEMVEAAYQCPVDLIAHGVPHRVFPEHGEGT